MDVLYGGVREKAENAAETQIAGAYYVPASKATGDEQLWKAFTVAKHASGKISARPDEHQALDVYGSTEEEIVAALEEQYPCTVPNGTYIVAVHGFRFYEKSYRGCWRQSHNSRNVVMRLRHPLISLAGHEDIDYFRDLTGKHGPVHLREDDLNTVFGLRAEKEILQNEFARVVRNLGRESLTRLNYNPQAQKIREYNAELREYKQRMSGEFPIAAMASVYDCLAPNNWPGTCKYAKCARGHQTYEIRGWGNRHTLSIPVDVIYRTYQLGQKVGAGPFYRNRVGYGYDKFNAAVAALLPYIHGAVLKAKAKIAEFTESYQRFVAAQDAGPDAVAAWRQRFGYTEDDTPPSPPRSLAEYIKEQQDRGRVKPQLHLDFCRWLLREAKIAKIEIPKAPRKPVKPQSRKKKREKARRIQNGVAEDI